MKKLGSALMLLSAVWLTTACDTSDENPKDTVGSAAKALQSDDKKGFRSLLTGEARAMYQSDDAVEQLQAYIDQFSKLSISSEQLIREETVSSRKTIRYYALEITGSKKHALDVHVKCQLNYGEYADAFDGMILVNRDGHGRPPAESTDQAGGNDGGNHTNPHGHAEPSDSGSSHDYNPPHENPHGHAEPTWPDHNDYEPPHHNPHGPAEPTFPDDRPDYPHRPNRPHRPHRPERPDYPERPTEPVQTWHQACRITSIQK